VAARQAAMSANARPLTAAGDPRVSAPPKPANDTVSYLDDIGYRPVRPRGRFGFGMAVLGALACASLGAGIYVLSGWPWQSPVAAIAKRGSIGSESAAAETTRNEGVKAEPATQERARQEPERQEPATQETAMPELQRDAPPPANMPIAAATPVISAPAPADPPSANPSPANPSPALPSTPPETRAEPAMPAVPQPAAPAAVAPTPEQRATAQRLVARAEGIIRETSDIAAARLFLERAADLGDGQAIYRLAQTLDPDWLSGQRVRGVTGNAEKARVLYERAADLGVQEARARLSTLR
jgi:hypothetical protein